LAAVSGGLEDVAMMREHFDRRRQTIVKLLNEIDGVVCPEPEGAFYAFPDVSTHFHKQMPDDVAVAKQLLEREHVAVVPGEPFGAPGHIRISYATSMERIQEGLRRLGRFFGRAA